MDGLSKLHYMEISGMSSYCWPMSGAWYPTGYTSAKRENVDNSFVEIALVGELSSLHWHQGSQRDDISVSISYWGKRFCDTPTDPYCVYHPNQPSAMSLLPSVANPLREPTGRCLPHIVEPLFWLSQTIYRVMSINNVADQWKHECGVQMKPMINLARPKHSLSAPHENVITWNALHITQSYWSPVTGGFPLPALMFSLWLASTSCWINSWRF